MPKQSGNSKDNEQKAKAKMEISTYELNKLEINENMKLNNNPLTNQGEDPFISDYKRINQRAEEEFDRLYNAHTFDAEWNQLAPERAALLTKAADGSDSADTDQWADSAEIYLLPFHSFTDGDQLNIRFRRTLSAASFDVKWRVLYFDRQAGGAAVYAADLLVLKRRIYEQGNQLKDCVEIDLEAELPQFVESFKEMEQFKELFKFNMTLSAKLDINRLKNTNTNRQSAADAKTAANSGAESSANSVTDSSNETRAVSMITGFSRCGEFSTRSQQSKSGDCQTRLRVQLGEYWLGWAQAARRAEFDFDYLSAREPIALQPIELRFYELVQFLRIRGSEKPVSAHRNAPLVIGYNEFTELMPLPRMKTYEAAEHQINELCSTHLTRGYLADISAKPTNQKGIFNDAELKISF